MRKPTSIVHIGLGLLAAFVALCSIGLAALLFFGFALYEYWSERHGHAGGYDDFREALLGLAIGCIAIVTLALLPGVSA
jgi:hypothetical protein